MMNTLDKILDKIARGVAWVLTLGQPDHPYGGWRALALMLIILVIGWFFACSPPQDEIGPDIQLTTSTVEKKGGNGKGNSNNPNNPNYVPPPPVRITYPGIQVIANVQWEATGGCTKITWDAFPNDLGYQIWFKDNCYCATTEVDSTFFSDGVYYKKHYNATTEEAYLGCLWEIGKDRWYDIRLKATTANTSAGGDTVFIQPWYSELSMVYVD